MNPSTSRRKRLVAAGVVATALSVAGTGAAMAANSARPAADEPGAPAAAAPDAATPGTPVDEEALAREAAALESYTQAQYDAFWASGYTTADLDALAALWGTEYTETKSRVGQMLLDGADLPFPPGSTPSNDPAGDAAVAFWDAGYTYEDAEALAALWGTDVWETKVRAGQALLDGEALPVAPGSSVTP
ncbi:hypothetical protein [Cellulomonas phragmiteti]|uniref:Uncharacterized protein n=1 Tax=Cellulomonas phragmiteti TaxID=478780 RepID=A0ABQ4DN62_9CELL|nr:hypothetical protein [Cellulomonas phragmiteti]GIG40794.1 hypothetical protein Cph01nite_25560 [Cellulomonas phragmiteti]